MASIKTDDCCKSSSSYKVTKFKADSFWQRLASNDLKIRLVAIREAKHAVIGTCSSKCYFLERGICGILDSCLALDGDSEEEKGLRLEATFICGCLSHYTEHARLVVSQVNVSMMMKQLNEEGKVVEATVCTLYRLCRCAEGCRLAAKEDIGALLRLVNPKVGARYGDRVPRYAADVLTCMVSEVPEIALCLADDGAFKSLLELFKASERPLGILASLQCAACLAEALMPLSSPTMEDIQQFSNFELDEVFCNEHLCPLIASTACSAIQTCAAELYIYNSLVSKLRGCCINGEFVRMKMLPSLVRIAKDGERVSSVNPFASKSLQLISLLLQNFADDVTPHIFKCEGFAFCVAVRLAAIDDSDGGQVNIPGSAEAIYTSSAFSCLAEMCRYSDAIRLQVGALPFVCKWIWNVRDEDMDCSHPTLFAGLRLIQSLSRSAELMRSMLFKVYAWKPALSVLREWTTMRLEKPLLLTTAFSIVANFMLSPAKPVLVMAGVVEIVKDMLHTLAMNPDQPHLGRIIASVLFTYRNYRYSEYPSPSLAPGGPDMCNLWKDAFVVLNRKVFGPQSQLAALKTICNFDCFPCDSSKKVLIAKAFGVFEQHFQILQKEPSAIDSCSLAWYVRALCHLLSFEDFYDVIIGSDIVLATLGDSIEFGTEEVQVRNFALPVLRETVGVPIT